MPTRDELFVTTMWGLVKCAELVIQRAQKVHDDNAHTTHPISRAYEREELRMWWAFKIAYMSKSFHLLAPAFEKFKVAAHASMDHLMDSTCSMRLVSGEKTEGEYPSSSVKGGTDMVRKMMMEGIQLDYNFFEAVVNGWQDPVDILDKFITREEARGSYEDVCAKLSVSAS